MIAQITIFFVAGGYYGIENSLNGPCMDDQTAITRIKQGELNGLESLVERYQARAVQAAYLIVFDQALAEDIAQTAFVKVAEWIRQFDDTRPFEPSFIG